MLTQQREFTFAGTSDTPVHLKPIERIVLERRATTHFDDTPVPEEELNLMLAAAAQAPSGYNLQPWRFLVVRDADQRARLRTAAFNQEKITEAPVVVIALGPHTAWRETMNEVFAEAARRGALPEEGLQQRMQGAAAFVESQDRAAWLNRHVMIAFTYLMLVAESLGWDTAPMEGFDPTAVRRTFGIPDDCEVVALLAIGRAKEPRRLPPGRLPIQKLTHAERYGQEWHAPL